MIDVDERWAYAIGVKPVLTQAVEKITIKQRGKAATLEQKIRDLAKALVNGGLEAKFDEAPSYKFLLDALGKKFNEPQVEEMGKALPPKDRMPYMTIAKRQFDFLSGALPKNTYSSVAGTENLDVSDPQMFAFEVFYQIADDPLCVFGSMCQAALLKTQVVAFKEIYPTMYDAIDSAITDAIIDRGAKEGEPSIDPIADMGIRVWRGKPLDVVPYQDVYLEASARKKVAVEQSQSRDSKVSKESMTGTQRTAYGVT